MANQTEMTVELAGLRNAWLSPDGSLVVDAEGFEGQAWHEQLAACIIRDQLALSHLCDVDEAIEPAKYAYEYLENQRWIRLHGFQGFKPKWILPTVFISNAQRKVIKQWCLENQVTWDDGVDQQWKEQQ